MKLEVTAAVILAALLLSPGSGGVPPAPEPVQTIERVDSQMQIASFAGELTSGEWS